MEDRIKKVMKQTESIIADSAIREEFKQVAFSETFRILWGFEEQTSNQIVKTNNAVKAPLEVKQKLSKSSRLNPADLVDKLIDQGFFNQRRKDIDCVNELSISKGVKVPRKQIATVLLRKLRSGKIKREKTAEGYFYFTLGLQK